ncbi:MAG: peptide chain release factor 2, partial [Actinomycetota bacterium]|nr:peptide chain release factor 2 [Actinomycetota bacterium]
MAVDFALEIKDLRATMESVRQVTDLDSLRTRISELEEQSGAPDLWDDPESA